MFKISIDNILRISNSGVPSVLEFWTDNEADDIEEVIALAGLFKSKEYLEQLKQELEGGTYH